MTDGVTIGPSEARRPLPGVCVDVTEMDGIAYMMGAADKMMRKERKERTCDSESSL